MAEIITMSGVSSSNIDAVGFGPREGTDYGQLRVQFKSGAVWEYDDVLASVHRDLVSAESVGKFYNQHIKHLYQGRRID